MWLVGIIAQVVFVLFVVFLVIAYFLDILKTLERIATALEGIRLDARYGLRKKNEEEK